MKKILFLLISMTLFINCSDDDSNNQNETNNSTYIGNWEGTYNGGDYGTWKINIDSKGIVTGDATSTKFNETFEINGEVNNDGGLNATLGKSEVGAKFIGTLNNNSGKGTWINPDLKIEGDWVGNKK